MVTSAVISIAAFVKCAGRLLRTVARARAGRCNGDASTECATAGTAMRSGWGGAFGRRTKLPRMKAFAQNACAVRGLSHTAKSPARGGGAPRSRPRWRFLKGRHHLLVRQLLGQDRRRPAHPPCAPLPRMSRPCRRRYHALELTNRRPAVWLRPANQQSRFTSLFHPFSDLHPRRANHGSFHRASPSNPPADHPSPRRPDCRQVAPAGWRQRWEP